MTIYIRPMSRAYISNLSEHWTLPKQEAALAAALPPGSPIYCDRLSTARRKARVPADLIQRASMLRRTKREPAGETIYVASLAVLAWTADDLSSVLAAISARHATLVALDTGLTIPPDAPMAVVAGAMQQFARGRRRVQTELGRRAGGVISAAHRSARAQAGCAKIADRWRLATEDYPTPGLLREADVSRNTANLYLGRRPDAQKKHRNALAQAARNRARSTKHVEA